MSYNNLPFWIRKQLERLNPKKAQTSFAPHYFKRIHRGLSTELIVETVRTGKVVLLKSLWPGKITFSRYFGKENVTYFVITIFEKHKIEVKTSWQKKGN